MSTAAASSAVHPANDAAMPAPLSASAIAGFLRHDGSLRSDEEWRVRVVATTGSTNSDLLASVRVEGCMQPLLLVAEQQTAGRGRLGRAWASTARASLTASFALRIARPMQALDGVTLACGLAVCDAVAGHGVDARLKWPNDLLVDGRKLAGILVEVLPVPTGTVLVVGVGINVEPGGAVGAGLAGGLAATDLRSAGGASLDRNRLVAGVGLALRSRLGVFESAGFAALGDEWNQRDAFRNQAVVLLHDGQHVTGIERGVDHTGALLIETAAGPRRIVSGDVSLRLANPR